MSAHGDRKKRIGSRRMAPKPKETLEADYHGVENMSTDQQLVPEEGVRSLLAPAADGSTSDIQHPPAPEVSMHRKKLGSSRRRRGGQHAKGFEPQENIEETESNSPKTQMSVAAQLEMHEELNRGSEDDISATLDTSMSSSTTTAVCLEDVTERLTPEVDVLQSCENERGADILEKEELKESTQTFDLSGPTGLGVSSTQLNQHIITNQAESVNVCVLAESESPVKDDSDLFWQDGSLQGDYSVDESHVKTLVLESVTTEKTANKSTLEERNEIVGTVEETNVLSPKEKFPENEHFEVFKLSEVTDSQHSESVIKRKHEKDGGALRLQDMHQNDVASQSATLHDKDNPDICSVDQGPENISTEQSELVLKSTDSAAKREVSTSDEKHKCPTREGHLEALDQKNEDGDAIDSEKTGVTKLEVADGGFVEPIKTVQSYEQSVHQIKGVVSADFNAPLDPQLQDSSVSMDEQIHPGLSLRGNRRKLASSRKIKERHLVKKPEEDILDKSGDVEALETTNILFNTNTMSQEEPNQDSDRDILSSMSQESSLFPISAAGYSKVQISVPTKDAEDDLDIVIVKSKHLPEDQDEREAENNLKVANRSVEVSLQEVDKSGSRQNKEDVSAHVSEDAEQELLEDEVHSTQMPKNLPSDYTSEIITEDVTFGNQIDQDKTIDIDLPDFTVTSPVNSAAKQEVSDDKTDVYPTKDNISEALGTRNEDYEFYDTNNPHMSDVGKVDSAPSQVHEFMGRVEHDLKTDAEQIFHLEKEGPLSETLENKSALLTFHSQSTVSQNFPEGQPEKSSVSVDEEDRMDFPLRKKMGSSRKNKGKQKVKDVVAEAYYEESDFNANSNESSEAALTETAFQEKSSEIMLEGEQKIDILQTEEANAQSGSPCTSESTIFGEHSASIIDELLSVPLRTDTRSLERDESTELLRQDEDFQPTHLVCKPLSLSEMETGETSRIEQAEPERRGEKASAVDELPTKEEHLSNVRVTRQSEDAVGKGHEQKIEPAQAQAMLETDYTIEKEEKDDATEKNESLSRTSNDQFEIGDIHWPEVAVKSVDDSQPQISGIKGVDDAMVDAHEMKNQGKDDMSQNIEETALKGIEGLFSEMGDTKMYLESLGYETPAPLDPQQSDSSFSPDRNRRALGSSRETSIEINLEERDKTDPLDIENITAFGQQNADLGTAAGLTEFNISSSRLSPAAELQLNQSYSSELPDDRLPTVSSITEKQEQGEDMEMLMSYGNSQGKENTENASTTGTTTEENSPENPTEFEYGVGQTFSSPHDTFLKNEEQGENFNSSETAETEHSEDVVSEAHKEHTVPTENQDMHQTDQTSITESTSSVQTLQSDTDVALDSKPQDNFFIKNNESQPGFKPAGNRRKMGSSRRNKGAHRVRGSEASQKPEEGDLENTEQDEATETLATKTRQEELQDSISTDMVEKSSSTGAEDENTVKQLEVNTCNPHSVVDISAVATSNVDPNNEDSPKSITDTNEKDTKPAEIFGQLKGFHNDKKDLMQASVYKADTDMQNILHHDDIINPANRVPDQEEVFQCQNTDALSCDKSSRGQEVQMEQTVNVIETVECFTTEGDDRTEVEGSTGVGRAERHQGEERILVTEEVNTSRESGVGKSTTMDTRTSGEGKTRTDYSENVQENPQQKKRKFASTRRNLLNRKQEGKNDNKDKTESENVQSTVGQQDTDEARFSSYEESKQQSDTSNQQSSKDDVIPVSLPESEVAVNPVAFDKVADKGSDEKKLEHCVEASPLNDFTSTEAQNTSVVAGENSSSLSQLVTSNTETDAPNAPGSSELQIKSASPDFNSTHRRKKIASTRRSLGSRAKGENLHQKQKVDNEATETLTAGEDWTDLTTESFSSFMDKQLQLQTEHKESYSKQDNEEEAVEITNVDESILQPLVEQKPQSQPIETQDQLTLHQHPPPSTSPKSDVPSDSASGGRKKKFGSNRRSRLHQSHKEQTQNVRAIDTEDKNVGGITEGGGHKAAEDHGEDPLCLNKISEVDENDDNEPPSINISKAEKLSQPGTRTAPVKSQHAEISLVQESKAQISFGDSRGMELSSDSYNVVMIGDSCVGKTSFMKRAQSGKFSLDIPASIGLDSCKWTVVVDGKPVLIQLWDTAGQERFRSITRQVFHKAQAFLLMYDVTSSQSFSAVSYWADCIQEAAAENVTVLLLGNKSDHEGRQVKTQQGDILAKEYNFEFMECSAATGENVIEALETVARMLSQRADLREEATVLHKEPVQKKRSTCC
ncbi:uncharacterized protein rab44 isoform X2 [Cololabis saira]|uniref:uncharacterized protein rab44 isoform X2 n=1 Tax=Cololabis saira TaxID=129043 RepID=UPI002AD34211|nr:uncharacterized protein rab44 isoform X2 [Cololabis saira]